METTFTDEYSRLLEEGKKKDVGETFIPISFNNTSQNQRGGTTNSSRRVQFRSNTYSDDTHICSSPVPIAGLGSTKSQLGGITSSISSIRKRLCPTRAAWRSNNRVSDAVSFGARVAVLVLVASLFATNQIPLGRDIEGVNIPWP